VRVACYRLGFGAAQAAKYPATWNHTLPTGCALGGCDQPSL